MAFVCIAAIALLIGAVWLFAYASFRRTLMAYQARRAALNEDEATGERTDDVRENARTRQYRS